MIGQGCNGIWIFLMGMDSHDLDLILKIPITMSRRCDELVWHYSNNGIYSVRSAYHLALDSKKALHNLGSSSGGGRDDWKRIWIMNIPLKIKLFFWHACKEFWPVRWNLYRRHMGSVADCLSCGYCGLVC